MQKSIVSALVAIVAFQTGLLVGQLGPWDAWAEPVESAPAADAPVVTGEVTGDLLYDPPRLYCKPFTVPLEGAASAIETNDRTTAIGRWVAAEEDLYELFSIDYEVAQKPTGYPTGIAWVCLSPRSDPR
jgi:hypothetical protein